MFTFKKYALVGVAALTALTMSCSEDEGGTYSYDQEGSVNLGGAASTEGSSLDIDATPFKVYKQAELVGSVPATIDLIFNGSTVFTPMTTTYLASVLANANAALVFDVPASTETADELVDAAFDEATVYYETSGKNVSAGTKFGVLTSEENLALVKVTAKDDGTQILTIAVSRTTGE